MKLFVQEVKKKKRKYKKKPKREQKGDFGARRRATMGSHRGTIG
jgi:hypothetical protein